MKPATSNDREMLHALAVMLATCVAATALVSMGAEGIQLSAGSSSVQLRHGGLCLAPATSDPRER